MAPAVGTRERLLDEALDLFTRQGYEATSLQQLADRLGVTKAAIYYHFRSKRDILSALVEPMMDDLARRMDRAECGQSVSTPAMLADYVDFLISQRRVIQFAHQDISWLGEMPELLARNVELRGRLIALLAGKNLSLDAQVRVTVALTGVQGALAVHVDADPAALRSALLDAIGSLLEPVRRKATGTTPRSAGLAR
ncbi:MAG TPA: helix-turn-helix domain-containing protein [Mycobacteriales bacterium]|jgi:AcrR family transcriptional regulator|nr:helix-turn-helix domain-containing protein [Mycobacteriales bacterium]